ncbi:MAG: DinB family protein [Anaerolineae bacterium]|nr:DinB family protein [Anaerolineae bacterium]
MTYRIGVEDIEPGQWVAWWFERPGITGGGRSLPEAVTALSRQVPVIPVEPIDVFRAYPSLEDPDYLVNAFFEDDRRPLSAAEIADGLARLHESRERLLGLIHSVGPEVLSRPIEGERFETILGILRHVAVAEWWYCDRLDGVPDWAALPQPPLEALAVSRQNTERFLPTLVDSNQIVTLTGEIWSPRKVLRRTIWHEADHVGHIQQRLDAIMGGA